MAREKEEKGETLNRARRRGEPDWPVCRLSNRLGRWITGDKDSPSYYSGIILACKFPSNLSHTY